MSAIPAAPAPLDADFYVCVTCGAGAGEQEDTGFAGWHGAGSPWCECDTYCPGCADSGWYDLCSYGEQ